MSKPIQFPAKFQFEFPPEIQTQREPLLDAVRHAMFHGELAEVQDVLRRMADWLAEHPEDYAIWDAGSDLTRLEEAILRTQEAEAAAAAN